LAKLQAKTAFLLGMAAFLRRSDLARINLLSSHIDSTDGTLFFEIVSPKEPRQGFRIIKPVLISPHSDPTLCPVAAFSTLRDHPAVAHKRPSQTLFVNSKRPHLPAAARTIGTWLTRLLRLSTSESRVSVRSLASSLALQANIPLDDIQTLGNWTNSATFQQHYRREHLSQVDFTNTVLSLNAGPVPISDDLDGSSDDGSFVDALSDLADD
jgi:hypothetical protein